MKPYLVIFTGMLCLCRQAYSQDLENKQDTLTVYFDFAADQPNSTSFERLQNFRNHTLPEVKLTHIIGYTDRAGSAIENLKLAQKRIEIVASYLQVSAYQSLALGEEPAMATRNYLPENFRKVEIIYESVPLVVDFPPAPKEETVIEAPVTEKKLSDKVAQFMGDGESGQLNVDLTILFYPGEATILPESGPEMNELLLILKGHPDLRIHIHGHVCCNDDQKLSYQRAKTVYDFLADNRVNKSRMEYSGHSNTQPKVYPERSEKDRIANRRVTIEFLKN